MPILDTVTGAAAAYSVRKLRTAYAGSALRVRRSSDDAEQDIGFSGNDLDTSALTTFVGANDGYVVTLYDQSGNGLDATQATKASQRQIVTSGTVETHSNGTPRMTGTSGFYTASVTLTQAFSNISVGEHTGGGTAGYYDYNGTGGTNRSILRYITSNWNQFSGTSVDSGVSTQTLAVFSDLRNGASSLLRRNGTQIAASNVGTRNLDGLTLFAITGASGISRVSESIFWDSDQSANFATIEADVATYYGITLPDVNVSATTDALTLTENAATVKLNVSFTATTDALTLTENAATVSVANDVTVSAGTAALTLTENAATVALDVSVSATTDALTLSELAASIKADINVSAAVDALTLATLGATVNTSAAVLIDPPYGATWVDPARSATWVDPARDATWS